MTAPLTITVNGQPRTVAASPWRRLLDVLREDLGLTGTKEGCGEGECGACTVLLDGAPVCSCLVVAGQADGRAVTTVEGLADGPLLHAVQRELVARGGAQRDRVGVVGGAQVGGHGWPRSTSAAAATIASTISW